MHLNPILKNVLVRAAYIIISPLTYYVLYHVFPSREVNNTIAGIWAFLIAFIVIWFNIRKLSKPIRLLTIGSYLLIFAIIVFWYKLEQLPFSTGLWGTFSHTDIYRIARLFCCIGFILLASILPIFLKSTDMPRFAKFSKIWIWGAVLLLDFAVAMPNIFFSDQMADKLYIGCRRIGNFKAPIYAIGNTDYPVFSVFLPQDSVCTYTSDYHYLVKHYERQGNLLIEPETRDTIWIEKSGASRINPNHQTIENNTSCLMRWQWQYYAWHKIKGLFNNTEK